MERLSPLSVLENTIGWVASFFPQKGEHERAWDHHPSESLSTPNTGVSAMPRGQTLSSMLTNNMQVDGMSEVLNKCLLTG